MIRLFPKIDKLILEEKLSYAVLWALVFALPLLGAYYRTNGLPDANFDWAEVLRTWKEYLPFLILFIIHDWLIAPLIVHENKKLTYLSIAGCALLLFAIYVWNQRPDRQGPPPPEQMEMRDGRRAPAPPLVQGEVPNFSNIPPEKPNGFDEPREMLRDGEPPMLIQDKLSKIFVALLMMGVNLGIMLYFKQRRREDELKELERQKLQQELEYLKYQINPHFFMNTLNNIHALVDIDPDKAKSTIIELSKLMRYVLYDSSRPTILLSKEIDFLKQYIALMRLRYTDRVTVEVAMPEEVPGIEVPPLLLIPFIENAFKHGVSYEQESFVHVEMQLQDDYLHFHCENSMNPIEGRKGIKDPYSGIGLDNVKKRLQLIYGKDYFFMTLAHDNKYEVTLKIPVKNDTMLGNR